MIGADELAALLVRVVVVGADSEGHVKIMNPKTAALAVLGVVTILPDLLTPLEQLYLKTVVGTEEERHAALNAAFIAVSEARRALAQPSTPSPVAPE